MKTKDSMNDYIEKTAKRYSSLFTLPSHGKIIWLLLTLSLLSGLLIASAIKAFSDFYYILTIGLTLGAALFMLVMVADFTARFVSLKLDPIVNFRRCSALSLYSVMIWFCFIVLGVVVNVFLPGFWFKLFLLGFGVVLALRLLVLSVLSFASVGKVVFYSVLLPVLYTLVVYIVQVMEGNVVGLSAALFFSLSLTVTVVVILFFIRAINRVGMGILGVSSFSVLRAFLASWTEDLNQPFEQLFERFGLELDIKVSALAFKTNGRIKAVIVVPAFHPGPFKSVGSSNLPYFIQTTLENKLPHCVIAVPHGLSGHDLDLASHTQNQLVLEAVQKLTEFSGFDSVATPFVRGKRNEASVGCQVFGNCALVTLTLAPETMEDLPPDLEAFIVGEAQRLNLSTAVSVDAHNSIQGPFIVNKVIGPLKEAATVCLEKASRQEPTVLKVGVAKVTPKEFGLREGMGQGGIVVTLIKVGGQHTAYVTIDGNNMISGLRERILSALSEVGVDDGEVFTTDTHSVNAVALTARGYRPVGEAIDQEILVKYIKQATMDALANLERAEVGWRTETVPGVKVIGEKQIESMCMLLDKAMKRAKKLAISIFPIAGLILVALLLLL